MTIRTGYHTFGDFLELVSEDQKADLLDGMILMASPESLEHNGLVRWFTIVLGGFIEERRLGIVTVNKVAYRLGDLHGPEPDLAFVAATRKHLLKHGYVDGPPDVAVEIVSPESVDRDYEHKRRRYEEAGVREYWIIDRDESRATFLQLDGGRFVEAPLVDRMFRSAAIPGFRFRPAILWQSPLPPALAALRELLADVSA